MTTILRFLKYQISICLLLVLFFSCDSDYERLVKAELGKGVRKDSILLGFKLHSNRYQFYGRCFDLNKQHLVMEGPGYSIRYVLNDSTVHSIPTFMEILFVPAFDEGDTLSNMDLKISYMGWASGDKRYHIDSLENHLERLFMKWYGGNAFMHLTIEEKVIPVKVDGNRRILFYRDEPQHIIVRIQDLLHAKYIAKPEIEPNNFPSIR